MAAHQKTTYHIKRRITNSAKGEKSQKQIKNICKTLVKSDMAQRLGIYAEHE
jgi:hypothetical protein